jgi:hypothetical protein
MITKENLIDGIEVESEVQELRMIIKENGYSFPKNGKNASRHLNT